MVKVSEQRSIARRALLKQAAYDKEDERSVLDSYLAHKSRGEAVGALTGGGIGALLGSLGGLGAARLSNHNSALATLVSMLGGGLVGGAMGVAPGYRLGGALGGMSGGIKGGKRRGIYSDEKRKKKSED